MANKKSAFQQDLSGRELGNAVVLFHDALASYLGMTAAEWKCIELLQSHGPSSASRLAELSGFTSGAITGIVDRLEQSEYVRREPHAKDRRSVIVEPRHTKELKERVAPIFESLNRAMSGIADQYSADELKAIVRFFRETTDVFGNETAKLKRLKYHKRNL